MVKITVLVVMAQVGFDKEEVLRGWQGRVMQLSRSEGECGGRA